MDIPRWIEQWVGVLLLQLHDAIYKDTNGRIGHRFMPAHRRTCRCPRPARRPVRRELRRSPISATVTPT
jgi:hypothetical protein